MKKYSALILDIDGTLYFQRSLRIAMAMELFAYHICRPWKWRDLKILSVFRKERERYCGAGGEADSIESDPDSVLYRISAERFGVPSAYVQDVVIRWMHLAPLKYLNRCADRRLRSILGLAREKGLTLAAFSDYPGAEKLKALRVRVDACFSATDSEIRSLKPDPRGLNAIMKAMGLSADECLMIGDRDEKDGECARKAGMDYLILPQSKEERKAALQVLEEMLFASDAVEGGCL
jgi:phosphoglycolate phosphatase/putative hydrolase of the HAD superfamily